MGFVTWFQSRCQLGLWSRDCSWRNHAHEGFLIILFWLEDSDSHRVGHLMRLFNMEAGFSQSDWPKRARAAKMEAAMSATT